MRRICANFDYELSDLSELQLTDYFSDLLESHSCSTAKLNCLDRAAWLKETLEKLPTWPNRKIDELLPFGHIEAANKITTFREYA